MKRNMLPIVCGMLLAWGCQGKLDLAADEDGPAETSPGESDPDQAEDPPEFDGMIPDADQCTDVPLQPGPSLARRMTNWEYVRTIQQTFGVDVSAEVNEDVPADFRAGGFSNTADAMVTTVDHADGYGTVAEAVVDKLDWTAWVDEHTSCTDFEDGCEREFVENAGQLAFRRPLTDEEVDNFLPIYDVVVDEGDDFYMGSELVLRAMLQSPQFLYRLESQTPTADDDGVRQLDGFEMANRLSYLVWHSAPDQELLGAAANGELSTETQIEAQVERMLADPLAREASAQYVTDWLGLDVLDTTVRDEELYPEFDDQRVAAMKQETLSFFDNLIWEENAPLMSMFTSEYTIVSRGLAEFYGFENPQDGENRYDLSDDPTRMGFLTHAGILTLSGKSGDPSLVERGIYVFDGMLCGTIVAPPVGVTQEVGETEPGKTKRFYSEQRLANDACKGCHSQFDPIGFALERYDGVGAYLTHDEHGNELRADGTFLDPNTNEEVSFMDTEAFLRTVAESQSARDCMIKKPVQFALGRALLETDACMLAGVKARFDPETTTYQDLIKTIATSPTFRVVRIASEEQ
jgi:hypothetical protein